MSGGQWMVVLIVAMVVIARIVRNGMRQEDRRIAASEPGEAARLREEVRSLKERLAVLERIATDQSTDLDRRIEALRGPDDPRPNYPARDRADHR